MADLEKIGLDGSDFTIPAGGATAGVTTFNGRNGAVVPQSGDYNAALVGLGNVDNTSDADKPVSTAMQAALDLKANAADMNTALAAKADTADLATVATSGSYNDLSDKPTIPAPYTLPKASVTELGGVKVGSGLAISDEGVLSATGGGGSGGRYYSQSQREIGMWLDDRKLYQKTIIIPNPTIPANKIISYQLPELTGHALGVGTDFGWVESCVFRNTNTTLMTEGTIINAMGVTGRTTTANASTLTSYAAYCGFLPSNGTFYLLLGGNITTDYVVAVVNYVRTLNSIPF